MKLLEGTHTDRLSHQSHHRSLLIVHPVSLSSLSININLIYYDQCHLLTVCLSVWLVANFDHCDHHQYKTMKMMIMMEESVWLCQERTQLVETNMFASYTAVAPHLHHQHLRHHRHHRQHHLHHHQCAIACGVQYPFG